MEKVTRLHDAETKCIITFYYKDIGVIMIFIRGLSQLCEIRKLYF